MTKYTRQLMARYTIKWTNKWDANETASMKDKIYLAIDMLRVEQLKQVWRQKDHKLSSRAWEQIGGRMSAYQQVYIRTKRDIAR